MSDKITINNNSKTRKTQSAESIVINAYWNKGPAANTSGCFITPIREKTADDILYYNPDTSEITLGPAEHISGKSFWHRSSEHNFFGPSNNSLPFPPPSGTKHNIACGDFTLTQVHENVEDNTVMGYEAMSNHEWGNQNVAIGSGALFTDVSGADNTAVGYRALHDHEWGDENVAIGYQALYTDVSGNYNTAVGSGVLHDHKEGDYNVAVGYNALYNDLSGNYNTAVGAAAMNAHERGNENVAVGYSALSSDVSGASNTAVGSYAMVSHKEGGDNVAVGYAALLSDLSGNYNTAVGANAMKHHERGNDNVALGYRALFYDVSGVQNTAVGSEAMLNHTHGDNNVAVGFQALYTDVSGWYNTAVGTYALRKHERGDNNVALGYAALSQDVSGNYNTAVGYGGLQAHTWGNDNVALGYFALSSDVSGASNTAVGSGALYTHEFGDKNVAVGYQALYTDVSGIQNTAVGALALNDHTYGNENVALGYRALFTDVSGQQNTAVGSEAMNQVYGKSNVAIGYAALFGPPGGSAQNVDNNTAVGGLALQVHKEGNDNVAIGYRTLFTDGSGVENTAVGAWAMGRRWGGTGNVGIGFEAMNVPTDISGMGSYNIAIGYRALSTGDASGCIVINATGKDLSPPQGGGVVPDSSQNSCYIAPIRNASNTNALYYNETTKEITYDLSGTSGVHESSQWGVKNNSFYGPSGNSLVGTGGGSYNIACGEGALTGAGGDGGGYNIGVGYEALAHQTGGVRNVAVGYEASKYTNSSDNTAIGHEALMGVAGTVWPFKQNIGIGAFALQGIHGAAEYNIAIGVKANQTPLINLKNTIVIDACGNGTVLPSQAGTCHIAPIRNDANNNALYYNATTNEITYDLSGTSGVHESSQWGVDVVNNNFYGPSGTSFVGGGGRNYNTVGGFSALSGGKPATGNTAFGYQAAMDLSGTYNVGMGYQTAMDLCGNYNVGMGYEAAIDLCGNYNVEMGYQAAKNLVGDFNVGMGYEAAYDLSGNQNVGIGVSAAYDLSGDYNVGIGVGAQSLGKGDNNVGIGSTAAKDLSGNDNVGIGTSAAEDLSGNYNVGIGWQANKGTKGDNNIAIGKKANDGEAGPYSNTIVLNARAGHLPLNPQADGACYIAPIRNASNTNALYYNETTKEITYDLNFIPAATAAEGRADALVTQLDPSQNPLLDNSGSKGLIWINKVQDLSTMYSLADSPYPAGRLGSAALGGKIYILGGDGGPAGDECAVYNPIDDTWTSLPDLPAAAQGLSAAALGGLIYASGEFVVGVPVFLIFDPSENSWSSGVASSVSHTFAGVGAINNKFYVAGAGAYAAGDNVATTEVYDPILNSWKTLTSMPTARGHAASAVIGGRLFVAGGWTATDTVTDVLEVYNPIDDSWATKATMPGILQEAAGCAVGGKLYILGGNTSTTTGAGFVNTIYIYDPLTNAWTTSPTTLLTPKNRLAAETIGGRIYSLNGFNHTAGGWIPTTEAFDPSFNPQLQVTYQGEDFYVSAQRGGPKTFVIPHPEHEGKMLRHACIEAPTRGTNIYEFQVTIAKANVSTKIALPTYFAKLNGRARVYVSAVDVFSHCYGAVDKTSTNVVIQNEKAGTFNVLVTGVRKDPGAMKYSATENIDDPILQENIPPSQTLI